MDLITGIDFGTTTALWAERSGQGAARIVPIGQNSQWMPTLVSMSPDLVVVGEDAETEPMSSLVRSVKTELLNGTERVTVEDSAGNRHHALVDEVVTHTFRVMRERAEAAGARMGDRVRLGCPAIWTAEPRRRLAKLARDAGIPTHVDDMLDEPIAAGVSWIMNTFLQGGDFPEGRVLVFDYGGGTLDIALLEVVRGIKPEVTVMSAGGLAEAGDAIDARVSESLLQQLQESGFYPDLNGSADDFHSLVRRSATRIKEMLTTASSAQSLVGGQFTGAPILHMSRSDFENAAAPVLERGLEVVFAVLREAELRVVNGPTHAQIRAMSREALASKVDYVLLSGGMSQPPVIRKSLETLFPGAKVVNDPGVDSPAVPVVSGLTFDDVVSDLNLHRPAFSIVVAYRDEQSRKVLKRETVYEAFEPLYDLKDTIMKAFGMGHFIRLEPPKHHGIIAEFTCKTIGGDNLELRVEDKAPKGIRIRMASARNSFSLGVNGQLTIKGAEKLECVISRWPVIRGNSVLMEAIEPDRHISVQIEQDNWWVGGE